MSECPLDKMAQHFLGCADTGEVRLHYSPGARHSVELPRAATSLATFLRELGVTVNERQPYPGEETFLRELEGR